MPDTNTNPTTGTDTDATPPPTASLADHPPSGQATARDESPHKHTAVSFWYECQACADADITIDPYVRAGNLHDHVAEYHADAGTVWFSPAGREKPPTDPADDPGVSAP